MLVSLVMLCICFLAFRIQHSPLRAYSTYTVCENVGNAISMYCVRASNVSAE